MADVGQTPLNATTTYEDSNFEKWLQNDAAEKLTPVESPPAAVPPPVVEAKETEHPIVPDTEIVPVAEPEAAPDAVETAPPPAPESEVDPDEPVVDGKAKKRPSWKQVRELERDLKTEREMRLRGEQERSDSIRRQAEMQAEIERIKTQIAGREPTEVVTEPDDPLTRVERKMQDLETRDRAREQQAQQMALVQDITQQEQVFQSANPNGKHYKEAVSWWQESEIKEAQAIGVVDAVTQDVMRTVPDAVRQASIQYGRPEREVAEAMAKNAILSARRDAIVHAARRAGRNVAESLWDVASMRGYKPQNGEPVRVSAPPPPQRNQTELREAARSLSNVPPSPPPPARRTIKTRQELLDIPREELGRYIDEMDRIDSSWLEKLG